ncbi:MAG: radical SAM protein [Planctomycetia bacterium]|nr:radical SAM protein [Planctomycetia bacterium]
MLLFSEGWTTGFDGPGRRYIFYLKGCNLRCPWCASPESISGNREIMYYSDRVEEPPVFVCPFGAVSQRGLDRSVCRTCTRYDCVTRWRHKAFEMAGFYRSPEAIIRQVKSVTPLAEGITFGGGEPTLQMDELSFVLAELRAAGIHTAVESNGTTDHFCQLPGKVDLLLCDLKREEDTNVENLLCAVQRQEDLVVRIPFVPGVNDGSDSRAFFCDLLSRLRRERPWKTGKSEQLPLVVEVLPLHHLGKVKYNALGLSYPMDGVPVPDDGMTARFRDELKMTGVQVQ